MFSKDTQILLCISSNVSEQEKIRNLINGDRNCVFVKSEREALSLLKSRLRPSLILLDLDYPGNDYFALFSRLKSDPVLENTPVIILIPEDSGKEAFFLTIGAADVIRKPLAQEVLNRRIDNVINSQYVNDYLITKMYSYRDSLAEEHKKLVIYTKQIIKSLSSAIDAKDTYTNGHSVRVAEYACEIAEAMGYDDKMLEIIYQAGLLHDIGKIGVSDTVLRKPGELNEKEMAAIRQHPIIGHEILSSITEIPLISYGARWHHERYDGKGYPDGLKGDEIPLIPRIICVADAYDAMTSNRSYRRQLSPLEAREEILRNCGTQFDPEIGKIAASIIEKNISGEISFKNRETTFTSIFSPSNNKALYA